MIRIGTRGSKLALAQTCWVKEQLLIHNPETAVDVRIIRTSADIDTTASLRSSNSTGVFVRELEEALATGEIDLAVHSMKDLPTMLPPGLAISAIPAREDVRDAIVSREPLSNLESLAREAVVGTGSLRRGAQLLAVRPDLTIKDIRGNVDTRLAKVDRGEYDVVILACAGLNRLGLSARISCPLDVSVMLPAPGQGALALETRETDSAVQDLVLPLHHPPTALAVAAERALLRQMGGGCNTPIGVHASVVGGFLRIDAFASLPDGTDVIRDTIQCVPDQSESAASTLAASMLSRAGRSLLAFLR